MGHRPTENALLTERVIHFAAARNTPSPPFPCRALPTPQTAKRPTLEELGHAEAVLHACGLRFDGYRYAEDTDLLNQR